MTAQELLEALSRMIRDDLIQPNSLVVLRAVGTLGTGGVEMAVEKTASRVVAAEPAPGQRVVKIIGF